MSTSESILQFLEQPANLATAYDVREWLKDAERHVFGNFWSKVQELLEGRLSELNCHKEWRVFISPSLFEGSNSYVAIAPASTDPAQLCGQQIHYTVTAQQLGAETGSCYFGIYRGAREDSELGRSMRGGGFKSNTQWSGWRYFKSVNLPDFCLNPDNIIRLNTDNQSSGRPVARAVAGHMLRLFEKYRAVIARLNES